MTIWQELLITGHYNTIYKGTIVFILTAMQEVLIDYYRRQRPLDDFTFPALFAVRAKAYLEKFPQYTMADLAHFAVKAYANANKNPLAHMVSRGCCHM